MFASLSGGTKFSKLDLAYAYLLLQYVLMTNSKVGHY